jgi:glycosyltransferase involved in cell wall biosynthesis
MLSAIYLAASIRLPIGRRIVHVHNADEHLPTSPLMVSLLREPFRRIGLSADRCVGISNHTLDTFLAGRTRRSGRDLVHYYGLDPVPFVRATGDTNAFRRSISLPCNVLVLLFAGRITPEKNPVFAIDVFAQLLAREPRAALVFAGAGSLEGDVIARAEELGVADRVRMLGWRSDLPEIMACADWFILPRPEKPLEGFGLAVVEAQLAGLRLLLSRWIADDPLLPSACVRRLSLRDDPEIWAQAAIDLMGEPLPSREAAFDALRASPMDMDFALADLQALHD